MIRRCRLFALLLLFAGVVGGTGLKAQNLGSKIQWMRGIYVAESPAPQPVPEAIAVEVAKTRATQLGRVAIRGKGKSMSPLYKDGVIMIVAPVQYNELRRGQTVVYENRQGQKVAHVLVTKFKKGWRVTGLNNSLHDCQGMNAKNLRGVVVDAFTPVRTTIFASR